MTQEAKLAKGSQAAAPIEVTDLRQLPRPNAAVTAAEVARAARRRRAKALLLKLCAFVLVPTALAAAYFAFVASNRYESVSHFTVDSSEARPTLPGVEAMIGLAGVAGAIRDTLAVRDFVLSREMLADLDQSEHFIAHYKQASADFWSRLSADASFEDAYDYYKDVVLIGIDTNSGVLTLRVRAYSPESAQRFSKRILERSEAMVNALAERARQDQIRFAQGELDKAEKRLSQARKDLVEVQQEHGEYNPEAAATATMTVRTSLEGELARARAELATLQSYMVPDAPQVIAASAKVKSLAGQAATESQRLVSPKGEKGLNASFVHFEQVAVEKEFATHAYQSALATLELARSNAARQHRYLATITRPSLADEAQLPRRWLGTLTVFLGAFLVFAIGSLLIATVKEHARL